MTPSPVRKETSQEMHTPTSYGSMMTKAVHSSSYLSLPTSPPHSPPPIYDTTALHRPPSPLSSPFPHLPLTTAPPPTTPFSIKLSVITLGMSNIIPWLSFISCSDYFTLLFPASETTFIFPLLYMTLLLVGTVATSWGGKRMNLGVRLVATNVLVLVMLPVTPFVITPLLHHAAITPTTALVAVYILLSLLSLCVAINQSTCYGVAGTFGSEFMCYLETGKGWAGLFIIGIRMGLKKAFEGGGSKEEAIITSTRVFFLFGTAIVFLALIATYVMFTNKWAASRLEDYYSMPEPSISNSTPSITPINSPSTSPKISSYSPVLARPKKRSFNPAVKHTIARRILSPALGVFLTFAICIASFPGIATSLHSTTLNLGDWFPIVTVAVYNTCDLVGKALPSFFMPFKGRGVLVLVAMQAMCLPVMIMEKKYDGSSTILGSDAVKLTTVGLLGLLTGYSATCCLMVAPAMVKTKFKEYAAQFMSMCLIVGLFVGSLIGVLVEKVMQIEGVKGGGASVPYLHWGGGDGGSGAGDGPVFENLN